MDALQLERPVETRSPTHGRNVKRRRHLPYQRAQTALRRIDISASTCMLPIPPPPAVVASSSDRLVLDAQTPAM
ncbi:hypothetical protein SeLEV6574_g03228 [Synchytrium endobioticum]|uniref:Uncharacterized protein n=1 Tax=Synchytrium endobioticum TaxID=286115 RepID=A0A507D4V1_9FUNG|nr:hypothetical protein SeLEV6574_g03228 [Synchytrium endobioticum]